MASHVWETVIVGGGPAGLAAGMHLARAGYRALLVERSALGGRARALDRIENYPGFPQGVSGKRLMSCWIRQARRWGLRFLTGEAVSAAQEGRGFRLSLASGRSLRAASVIWCPGVEFRRLGAEGEERFAGRGVWNAALDSARRWKGQAVAVAGSGEAAIRQALALARHGARVRMISRSGRLRAHRMLLRRLRSARGVSLIAPAVVERLEGGSRLRSLVLKVGANGRARRETLESRALFALAGSRPRPGAAACRRAPGFFVAGDAASGRARQVAVAGGSGVACAMKSIAFLEGGR